MPTVEQLKEQIEDLKGQQKQAEFSYHQIAGAITVLEGQVAEAEGDKNPEKKSKIIKADA